MKTIGLLGGLSWKSTSEYYQVINQLVSEQLGGFHSAKIVINSLDFAEIEKLQHSGQWDEAASIMVEGAQQVMAAGAECLLICSNTMHKVAESVSRGIAVPLLHIADATGIAIKAAGVARVALLGSRFTMEQDFYRNWLSEKYGLKVVIPNSEDREIVDKIIYDELCKGIIRKESRESYLEIIERLSDEGSEGVILGCTEIGLLVGDAPVSVRLFDTAAIHAEAAVDFALGN